MAIQVQWNAAKRYFEVQGIITPQEFTAFKDRNDMQIGGETRKLAGKKRSAHQVLHLKALEIPELQSHDGYTADGPVVSVRAQCTLTASGFEQPATPETIAARKQQQTVTRVANAITSGQVSVKEVLRKAYPNMSDEELDEMVQLAEQANE